MTESYFDVSDEMIVTLDDLNLLVKNMENGSETEIVKYFFQDYSKNRVGFNSSLKSLKIIVKVSHLYLLLCVGNFFHFAV